MGDERLGRPRAVDRRRRSWRGCWRRPRETVRYSERTRRSSPLRGAADLPQALEALTVEGRALEAAAAAGAGRLPRFGRRDARCHPPRRRRVSHPAPRGRRRRARSRRRSRRRAAPSIPAGEVVDHASPALRSIRDRLRKQKTRLRGHARVLSARPRHREVSAGPGGHRAQRPLRAGGQGGTSRRHPGHRARRVGERRQPLSRAARARSKSTTTSSRSRSRKPRRSAASCWS